MSKLPEDIVQYLRVNRICGKQKALIRELAREYGEEPRTAAEYVRWYVKRIIRISEALDKPL